jgi:hypothetical protein
MKKVILSLVLAAGFSCVGFAQFRMSIGPVLGFNYNFLHGTVISNANRSYNGAGVSAGGQLDMGFTSVVGMLATITVYDMMSTSGKLIEQGVTTVQNMNLGYLMINPALKFAVPGTGLGFFAGPGVGFKLKGTTEQYQIANGIRTPLLDETDLTNLNVRVNGQVACSTTST